MDRIGIFLMGMPKMLRELIKETTFGEPDMEVVGESDAIDQLDVEAILEAEPTVVIFPMEGTELPAPADALLRRFTAPQILGLQAGGRRAHLFRLHATDVVVEELSSTSLKGIIRGEREGQP